MLRNLFTRVSNWIPEYGKKTVPTGTLTKDMKSRSRAAEDLYIKQQDRKNLEKLAKDINRK